MRKPDKKKDVVEEQIMPGIASYVSSLDRARQRGSIYQGQEKINKQTL